ncbi:SPOSA6832_04338 [Sporobolomyces salmonicolor]|uniref:mannan endo-1,4-beta-mannosidase n=1 Tax=Sporidiobolus salmonicolor TaxID=5005 RepID=A0A0D6ERD7_SPOSA|nr:SPOSA6832_04338 [Sporobolomyces salmonicolor]
MRFTTSLVAIVLLSLHTVSAQGIPAREVWRQRYLASKQHHLEKKGMHHSRRTIRTTSPTSSSSITTITTSSVTSTAAAATTSSSSTLSTSSPSSTSLSSSASRSSPSSPVLGTTSTTSSSTSTTLSSSSSSATPAPSPFTTGTTRALVAATTSSAKTCAPTYTAGGFTITGTGTLPKPTSFVKKAARSQQLTVNNQPFRIVGPKDENYGPIGSYTDKGVCLQGACYSAPIEKSLTCFLVQRVREALAIAVAMGANTIRALSCGISVGPNNPYNLEPSWNVFNSSAVSCPSPSLLHHSRLTYSIHQQWDIRDYVIYAAREYGLRIILTLTDNYNYYTGGKYDYINFRHASSASNGIEFFTNRAVQNAYGTYIGEFMQRVNTYTGVTYANDPTILAWFVMRIFPSFNLVFHRETGNELGGYINAEAWPPVQWTTQIIRFITEYDTNHLILDGSLPLSFLPGRDLTLSDHTGVGSNGIYNYTTKAEPAGLTNRGVDIVSDHAYPRNVALLNAEIPIATKNLKAFLLGEMDWTVDFGGDTLSDYIAAIDASGTYLGE